MDEKALEGGGFFVNHIPYEKWQYYLRDELEEKARVQYEEHLYDCDQCLALYSEAVEEVNQEMPSAMFTDQIMQKIAEQNRINQPTTVKKSSFYQKAVFHYVVAAAMTIILMSSGIFANLVNVISDFESQNRKESSIVSGLMDKSLSIINGMENGSKEENNHE